MEDFPASQWSQLSLVPLNGDRSLVIDRGNGRWALIDAEATPLVRLLAVDAARLPGTVALRRDRLAEDLETAGLGGRRYFTPPDLNTVILKLTKLCNYACSYCYDLEPDDRIEHMPPQMAVAVVREALELTPRRLGVILHGGEPTLLFDLVRHIVLEGERAAAESCREILFLGQTNLSRLNDEMVAFSTDHRVSWGVSIDGPPEINDRFRVNHAGAGTYHHFQRALERYPDFVRRVGILSTITSLNDRILLPIARHFRDLGMPSWNWSLFQPIGQGRGKTSLFAFSTDRLLDSWNELFDAVEAGEFDGMRIGPVASYLENFLLGPGRNMCMKRDCGAARDLMSVSADGSIHACDCIDPRGPHSDLGLVQIGSGDSLQRARRSDRAETIRSRDVTLGKCESCPWLAVCGGTCLAHADHLHGVWEAQCQLALLAFSRIATALAESDALRRYWNSLPENRRYAAEQAA